MRNPTSALVLALALFASIGLGAGPQGGGPRMLAISRPKGSARQGAARPLAWRRSASGQAFVIVSRIARCSLPLLVRILRASRSSAEPSRLVTRQPASATISAPAAAPHGLRPNSQNASTRLQAT
jgi:hypothetical protein